MTPEPLSEQQIEEALGLATKIMQKNPIPSGTVWLLARALLALQARLRESERAQHRCVFPSCVDGDKPEWCGHCGDASRAEAAEQEAGRLREALVSRRVADLEEALSLAESDPLFATDLRPYFKRIMAALAPETQT